MSEELLKELSQLQDELTKLQPAIEQIERTSQSAELIEKKIPKVTKRLSSIKKEVVEVYGEIKATVNTFEEISSDVTGKLDQINAKLEKTIVKYEGKADKQRESWDITFKKELSRLSAAIKEAETSIEKTNETYTDKIASLIKDVRDKSKEIFEIHDVLAEIKAAQEQYADFMEKAEKILKEKLESESIQFSDKLHASVKATISDLKKDSEQMLSETSSKVTNVLTSAQSQLEDKEAGLVRLNTQYEGKVDSLVEIIESRATEITEIYEELENIRETNKKYATLLETTDHDSKRMLGNMQKEFENLRESAKSSEVLANLESLGNKVKGLEEHAHKHNFGGIPIQN